MMIWIKRLLVFLIFIQYAQADGCTSKLLSCSAFKVATNPDIIDYELVLGKIPNNSINSICKNIQKPFLQAKLGRPGCTIEVVGHDQNYVAISTRRPGTDTTTGFDVTQSTFKNVLQCTIQELGSCEVLDDSSLLSRQTGSGKPAPYAWMANRGDVISIVKNVGHIVKDLAVLKIQGSKSTLQIRQSNAVGQAIKSISNELAKKLLLNKSGSVSTFLVLSEPISSTVKLVATFDLITSDFAKQAAELESSDWLALLQGLISAAIQQNTGSMAGAYATVGSGTLPEIPEMHISIVVDALS